MFDQKIYAREWYQKNKGRLLLKSRKQQLKQGKARQLRKYGLSLEEYEKMEIEQNKVCKICKKSQQRRLAVDHNHRTGRIRGLLCGNCNRALGMFKEDKNLLLKAIYYLDNT